VPVSFLNVNTDRQTLDPSLEEARDRFEVLYRKEPQHGNENDPIILEWREIWMSILLQISRSSFQEKLSLIKELQLKIKDFRKRYSNQMGNDTLGWLDDYYLTLNHVQNIYYGLSLLINAPKQKKRPSDVTQVILEGFNLIAVNLAGFFNWLGLKSSLRILQIFENASIVALSNDAFNNLVYKSKEERRITLRNIENIRIAAKSILWDISKIKKDALQKTTWDEELEKYRQWDLDMERAEDLTDEEEKAYERVMQRLGA
jgi:hypothetical protein